VKTDALDYTLTAILSIMNKEDKVHPAAFHSHTFTAAKLNYNTHDKELLAIFKAFKIWQYYLEGPAYYQHCYRSQKHRVFFYYQDVDLETSIVVQVPLPVQSCHLGTKPDALTRQWDIYPKGGNISYVIVNLHNFKPIFTQEQLAVSI